MSSLYVIERGKLISRDPQKLKQNKPTVIHYNHIIRQIPEVQCNCQLQKQKLIHSYETQLDEKDIQISILIQRIGEKETLIENLEEQLSCLRNHENTPAMKQQNYSNGEDENWLRTEKSLNSTVVSTFSVCEWNETAQKIKKQELKTQKQFDDCFKKTNSLMSQIDKIMKKKRKYQFHNSILVEDSIIEQLQISDQKSQEDTQQIQMQETFCIPQSEYNQFDSLDMTTFESVQNFGDNDYDGSFYSKLLKDSILLKNTIIQMKQESEQQLNSIQAYYQNQLRISYEKLQKERQKNSLFEITKEKLGEISQKGRQALAQIDQNQTVSFYIDSRNAIHSIDDGKSEIINCQSRLIT